MMIFEILSECVQEKDQVVNVAHLELSKSAQLRHLQVRR